jgi:hypothetical protein
VVAVSNQADPAPVVSVVAQPKVTPTPKRESLGKRILRLRPGWDRALVSVMPVNRRKVRSPVEQSTEIPVLLPALSRHSSISIDRVKLIVAGYYKVKVFDLESNSRIFARPRDVAIYLSKGLSWTKEPAIAKLFNRDRTIVYYVIKKIERLARTDAKLVSDIRKLYWLIIEDRATR